MKKFLFYGLSFMVLLIIAGVLYFWNQEFFNAKQSIVLLKPIEGITTPEWSNGLHFLIIFVLGFVVREFFRIVSWFGKRKNLKDMNRRVRMQQEKITALENELELIRGGSPEIDKNVLEAGKSDDAEIIYSKEGVS